MNVHVIGISHRTASVEVREKFFLRPLEREIVLNALHNDPAVAQGIVISTCNRTEIYANVAEQAPVEDLLINILFQVKKLGKTDALKGHFYFYSGQECVRHFLRVTTGLESLVLGEKQILGQVKEAVELSRRKGMLSKSFNILADIAVRAGKKAQSETDIGCGGGSVSWAAVKTAEKILMKLTNRSVLIVGAGKMSALTADQLASKKIGRLYVMNRTREKALVLAARFAAEAVSFSDIEDVLAGVDLCICSASAPHYLIAKEFMEKIMRRRNYRELICIDISTPRNIDPGAQDVRNVSLFTIDDLQMVLHSNMEKRKTAIIQVEKIISDKICELNKKLSCDSQPFERVGSSAGLF